MSKKNTSLKRRDAGYTLGELLFAILGVAVLAVCLLGLYAAVHFAFKHW